MCESIYQQQRHYTNNTGLKALFRAPALIDVTEVINLKVASYIVYIAISAAMLQYHKTAFDTSSRNYKLICIKRRTVIGTLSHS